MNYWKLMKTSDPSGFEILKKQFQEFLTEEKKK